MTDLNRNGSDDDRFPLTTTGERGSKRRGRDAARRRSRLLAPWAAGPGSLEDRLLLSLASPTVLPGFSDAGTLGRVDDMPSARASLGFSQPINFFGSTYSDVFINNNGNVTFSAADTAYTPTGLTSSGQVPRIAPFFADVDTRGAGSGVVSYGTGTVTVNGTPRAAFGVDWPGVGYYNAKTNKLDTFQLVIIDRSDTGPGNFDIEMNYDQVQWETGDAGGGVNGLGGTSAHVGFTNGTGVAGTNYEFAGSGVNGGLLDTNLTTGLVNQSFNSTIDGQSTTPVDGRYIFQARGGLLEVPPRISADLDTVSVAEGGTATNSGNWSDSNLTDNVTLSASVGTVTRSGTDAQGLWNWSLGTTDGPAQGQPVTITASDGNGGISTTSFALAVDNVAPTATLSTNGGNTYGTATIASLSNPIDPSADDTTAGFHYAFSVDTNTTGTATYANSGASSTANFGVLSAGTHNVFARIIDKDGGSSDYNALVTVNKAHLTVSADPSSKTYDGLGFSPFTATITGFVNDENSSVVVGSPDFGGTAVSAINAGNYTITPTAGSLAAVNYDFGTFNSATMTINLAPSISVATGGSFTYDGTTHAGGSARVSGAGVVTGGAVLTYSGDRVDAGSYTVIATYPGDVNHTGSSASATITIARANAVVVVTPYTVTYDGQAHSATVASITGVAGQTGSAVGSVTLSSAETNAGSYADTYSFAGTANYNSIASTAIADTINMAASTVTVSVAGGPFTYNGSARTPATVSVTGAGGLSLTPAAAYSSNLNAGLATASYAYAGDANHTASSGSRTFAIGKANARVVVTPYAVSYDGQAHSATLASITGVNGETGATVGSVTLNTTHTAIGTYADTYSFAGTANYNSVASVAITDTINKVPTSIALGASTAVPTQGQSETFTATVTTPSGTPVPGPTDGLVTFYDGTTSLGTATLSPSPGTTSTATLSTAVLGLGAHEITASYSGDGLFAASSSEYAASSSVQSTVPASGLLSSWGVAVDGAGDVFIADISHSRVVEVKPDGTQLTVGSGLNYPAGVAVDGAGDVFIVDSGHGRVVEVKPDGSQVTVASGLTPWGVALDGAGNLFITEPANHIVVEVKPDGTQVTVGSGLNDPDGIAVDGAGNDFITDNTGSRALEVKANNGGQVPVTSGLNQPRGIAVDGAGNVFIADSGHNRVLEVKPDGTQVIVLATGLNYPAGLALDAAGDVFFVGDQNTNRVVEVTRGVPVTVTPPVLLTTAALPGGTYGSAYSQALTAAGGDGGAYSFALTSGALPSGLGLGGGTLAGTLAAAGDYAFTITATDRDGHAASQSYDVVVGKADATVVVTPYAVTYDGAAHSATVASITGVAGQTGSAVGSITLSSAETNVGSYADTWSFAGNANYNSTSGAITDTITPAPLTVTANDASRLYGGPDPTPGVTYAGFVPGEGTSVLTGSPSLTSSALVSSHVGTYAITAGPGTLSAANYSFLFEPGILTINAAPLTITANDQTITYGVLPTPTASYSGLVDGDTPSVIAGLSLSTAPVGSNVGAYPITVSGAEDPDYYITGVSGSLNIIPANLAIAATASDKVYDGTTSASALPTVTGLYGNDSVTGLSESYTDRNAGSGKALGVNPGFVVNDGNGGKNYVVSLGKASGTISPLMIIGSITPSGKVYDGTTSATIAGYSLSGAVAGDAVSYAGGTATFADKNVGTAKTVSATGLSLTGTDAGNYTVNTAATASASITPAPLTITASNQATVYGQALPTLTGTALGVYPGDQLTVNYATTATRSSPVGGYPITVSGLAGKDAGNYSYTVAGASVTPGKLAISPDSTMTTLASSAAPSVFGQAVSFTATVAAVAPGSGTPGGTVQFLIDGVALGLPVSLVGGVAVSPSTGTLGVAGHTVTAAYTPADGNDLTSSGNLTQSVNRAGTAVTLAASPGQSAYNHAVTFTATVNVVVPGTTLVARPTGTVNFYDGSMMIGSGTLSTAGGVTTATFTTSTLAAGTHQITAVYRSDANFLGATSPAVAQTVLSAAQQAGVTQVLVQSYVDTGLLSSNSAVPLLTQLSNAASKLSSGNTTAGVNQLNAAINKVNALINSGRLGSVVGQALIDSITLAIDAA